MSIGDNRLLVRNSAARNRAAKANVLLCALALGLGVSVGYGQWLETQITLPDSLGGASDPFCLTADTSERYVYIGDASGRVYVVDAEAGTRVAKIPCIFVAAVCTNTRQNRVYAADYGGNRVLAISCATNQVVATIRLGAAGLPLALCYNSSDDKIYVASDGGDLTVIECSSDSAVKTMHLGESPNQLCYNPASNRVFYTGDDSLLVVIDGASDSVVAVHVVDWSGLLVVNAVADRVYMAGCIDGDQGVFVLDGATGAVLDSMNAARDVMCLNPRTQKLYTGSSDLGEVYVFDCAADTLVARLRRLRVDVFFSMACDTVTDRVYATSAFGSKNELLVIDGVADTLAARTEGPSRGRLLTSSKRGRVYCTDDGGPALAVFDIGTDSVLHNIMIGASTGLMCYDSTDDKIYYVSQSFLGEAGAIDAATNQPVGHVRVGRYPQSVVWHAPTDRVYCGGGWDITVIDATADTVTKVLPVPGYVMCSAPRVNKVYAFRYLSHVDGELVVIDCRNDSVIDAIPIPTSYVSSMCYAAYDKLYVAAYYDLFVVDCVKDSIIRSYAVDYHRIAAGRDGKRVYCASSNALRTFDPAGDTVVAEVSWESYGLWGMVYAPVVDKVYCVDTDGFILVGDGATDSLVAEIPLDDAWSIGYDSASGLVFCGQASNTSVTFIDSRTDSVIGSLGTDFYPEIFVTVPAHNRVYVGGWTNWGTSSLPVIRTDQPGVVEAGQSSTSKNPAFATIVSSNSPLVVIQPSVLLDAVGRRVFDTRPGLRSLSGLRAGVYFLRSCTNGEVVKILLVD